MKLLTYSEAAQILGIKLSTLYALVSRRRIPHVRLGGRLVRFDRVELTAWVEAHRVTDATGVSKPHCDCDLGQRE